MIGVAKNQKVRRLDRMSLMSRKWTVSDGDEEAETEGEDVLDQDDDGQEEDVGGEGLAEDRDEGEQDGQAEEEVDEVAGHGDHGQDLGREEDLLDEVPVDHQDVGRFEQGRREPGPGQDPAEEEQGVKPGGALEGRVPGLDDEPEDDGIDDHQEERVEERPEEAENGPPIAGLELPADQVLDEDPVVPHAFQVRDNAHSAVLPEKMASASEVYLPSGP